MVAIEAAGLAVRALRSTVEEIAYLRGLACSLQATICARDQRGRVRALLLGLCFLCLDPIRSERSDDLEHFSAVFETAEHDATGPPLPGTNHAEDFWGNGGAELGDEGFQTISIAPPLDYHDSAGAVFCPRAPSGSRA